MSDKRSILECLSCFPEKQMICELPECRGKCLSDAEFWQRYSRSCGDNLERHYFDGKLVLEAKLEPTNYGFLLTVTRPHDDTSLSS